MFLQPTCSECIYLTPPDTCGRRLVPVHWSYKLNLAKVADVSKLTMALFANINLTDIKKGNNTMFVMVSTCPERVTLGQFACALMYYVMLLTIVHVTNCDWGVLFWQ